MPTIFPQYILRLTYCLPGLVFYWQIFVGNIREDAFINLIIKKSTDLTFESPTGA